MSRIYNLTKDIDDARDLLFMGERAKGAQLPAAFDLRDSCPPVWDQGDEGSCTSHAGCACRSMLQNDTQLDLSKAFLYYQERALEGKTQEDSGATIRDICKATQQFGICPSEDMPYVAGDYKNPPSQKAIENAVAYKILNYKRVLSCSDVKQSLVSRRQPVLIGITVYESIESSQVTQSGILPCPKWGERVLGGHAVLIVGYKDETPTFWNRLCSLFFGATTSGSFIVRNSWGEGWGQKGYFMMPYAYFNRYAYDCWIMEK
jgi:C1A family cysteine protease